MQLSSDDKPTSWVEDLDPEPSRREGMGQKRELILGLMLLLAVATWAGWQWWSQAQSETKYTQGAQAQSARRLDEAESYFSSIPDYKDANIRAQQVARQIDQRNERYSTATKAANSNNWLAAYAAAQQVLAIQPGYRNAQSILQQAQQHLYGSALNNVVVSRTDTSPPGLYYRNGDNWTFLQDSDLRSEVRGFGPPGHMVYDVPGTNTTRTFYTDPAFWLKGSRLMLATFTPGGITFQPLSLDPSKYDFFVWGDQGVWGLKSLVDNSTRPTNTVRPDFSSYTIAHEKYGSPLVTTLPDKGSGWFLMDFAPDGQHLLYANIGDYGNNNPITQLYVADADGTNLHFVYTTIGGFFRAIFSPNSAHILATSYVHVGYATTTETQDVVLLNAQGTPRPVVLAETDVTLDETSQDHLALSSSFLQSGKYAGRILMVEKGKGHTTVSIIDPDDIVGHIVYAWSFLGDVLQTQDTWSGEVQTGTDLLLVLESAPDTGNPYINVVWDAYGFGTSDNHGMTSPVLDHARIDLNKGEQLQHAWFQDGYLIYATISQSATANLTLYSHKLSFQNTASNALPPAPTQKLLDNITGPQLLYRNISSQPAQLLSNTNIIPGPGLLAYEQPDGTNLGPLTITAYDGKTTAQLSTTGYKLYDWSQYTTFHGLR